MEGNQNRSGVLFMAIVVLVGGVIGLSVFPIATAVQINEASITFSDQTSNGTTVTVESVVLPNGGFVAIKGPNIIGVSEFLEAGEHTDVVVSLDTQLTESRELIAVAHRDTNNNQEFEFTQGDLGVLTDFAYGIEDEVVRDTAQINVEETDGIATQTTTTVPTQESIQQQTPYNSSVATIPGRIQAEEFDKGGQGVAYNDSENSNQGGAFRPAEGVDIQVVNDTGGEYNVGWTVDGEWLEYTVNVTNGTYDIRTRVAAPEGQGEKAIRFELNGTSLGTVEIPQTGGYQSWQTVTLENVTLSGDGPQVLRLEIIGGDYNINWIEFTNSSTTVQVRELPY